MSGPAPRPIDATTFASAVHVWNAFYGDMAKLADAPSAKPKIVFVRYEDFVLRVDDVTRAVCECVSGRQFAADVALRKRAANPRVDLREPPPRDFDAVFTELSAANATRALLDSFATPDLRYLLENVDLDLLRRFGYSQYASLAERVQLKGRARDPSRWSPVAGGGPVAARGEEADDAGSSLPPVVSAAAAAGIGADVPREVGLGAAADAGDAASPFLLHVQPRDA